MRQHYTNKISADVVRELRAGRAPTDFKLDLGAPAMKKLLAESLAHAHALLAQQPEKMLKNKKDGHFEKIWLKFVVGRKL